MDKESFNKGYQAYVDDLIVEDKPYESWKEGSYKAGWSENYK